MHGKLIRLNADIEFSIEKVIADVERDKKDAVSCLHVGIDGRVTNLSNERSRLNVLSVVGPYQGQTLCLTEAVLLEVGMGKAKPYTNARIPTELREEDDPMFFMARLGHFQPSRSQYRKVAPRIFEFLRDRAFLQVAGRPGGWQRFPLRESNSGKLTKVIRTKRGRYRDIAYTKYKRPFVRFSVSLKDEFLVQDICWAEQNSNKTLKRQLDGLGRTVNSYLNDALRRTRRPPKHWRDVTPFHAAMLEIEKLNDFPHLQAHFLEEYIGQRNYFYDEIAKRISWGGEPVYELEAAKQVLSRPEQRLKGIEIRIYRRMHGNLIFDVYPPPPSGDQEVIPF